MSTPHVLDLIMDGVDTAMMTGDPHEPCEVVDHTLGEMDPLLIPDEILVGILTATLEWKSRLPTRALFFDRVDRKFALKYDGARRKALLGGLV